MDAVILAGGRGTRLRPLTDSIPKPLIDVRGKPLLEWSLMTLRGVADRVIVVASYLQEQVRAFMASQRVFADYVVIEQLPKPLGTGHALMCCKEAIASDDFLVLNGDDLYPTGAIRALAAVNAGVLTVEREDQSRWGVVVLDERGGVARLHEKPADGTYPPPVLVNTGAYKFTREVFNCTLNLSPRGEYEITDYVTWLAERTHVLPIRTPVWITVGTPEDHAAVQRLDFERLLFDE